MKLDVKDFGDNKPTGVLDLCVCYGCTGCNGCTGSCNGCLGAERK